jgi:hypothetical protein
LTAWIRCYIFDVVQAADEYLNNVVDAVSSGVSTSVAVAEQIDPVLALRRSARKKSKSEGSLTKKLAALQDGDELRVDESAAAAEADRALNNFSLRFARNHPKTYLKVVGHLLVMSELVALLTPVVAMGIQWVTALCDGPPVPALLGLFNLAFQCVGMGNCQSIYWKHCILKEG